MNEESIESIGDLLAKLDPKNAREHNPRNLGMIVDSLHEVGAARSIVIDENGRVLAGNATVEAAAEAGIERIRIVDADGEEIIAVRRKNLTEEQKKKLAYYDNRTAELADWDPVQILMDMEEGFDFSNLFYENELQEIVQGVGDMIELDFDGEVEGFAEGTQFGEGIEVSIQTNRDKLNEISRELFTLCERHGLLYKIRSMK